MNDTREFAVSVVFHSDVTPNGLRKTAGESFDLGQCSCRFCKPEKTPKNQLTPQKIYDKLHK
jgi:hypothetical protein